MVLPKDLFSVYLYPGELYIADTPTVVTTNLGSCVSVVFFSPQLRIGAICHGRLPQRTKGGVWVPGNKKKCFEYMDCSIVYIIDFFKDLNIKRNKVVIEMYGGSNMFHQTSEEKNSVGWQNIDISKRILNKHGLYVSVSDVGGYLGRKVIFNSQTGKVSSIILQKRADSIRKLSQIQKKLC